MADPNNRCSAPPSWQRSPVPKRAPSAGCWGGGGTVGAAQGFGNALKSAARVRRAPRLGGPAKRRCGLFLGFLPGTAARQACPAPSAWAGLGGRVGRWKRSGRARRRAGEARARRPAETWLLLPQLFHRLTKNQPAPVIQLRIPTLLQGEFLRRGHRPLAQSRPILHSHPSPMACNPSRFQRYLQCPSTPFTSRAR